MDACPKNYYGNYPWQASLPGILRNLKEEFELLQNTSAVCYQPVRKKITTEALVTLTVILSFIFLNLIRSAIGVYESCTGKGKETHSSIERKEKVRDGKKSSNEKKKLSETSSSTASSNLRRFLDCFCIKSNARSILNTEGSKEEQLSGLHGIRCVILIWVLLGHISAFYAAAVKTTENFLTFLDSQGTQILKNAVFIIDAFLVLSGFLNGYLFSQLYEKRKGKVPWLLFYVHRFLRISPLYFIVLGFYTTIFPYLGSGPFWPTYETNPMCKDNWMWNVFYISNFISHQDLCITTTWYLPCEMQLYMISPIFLVLLIRKPKMGYFLVALGISISSYINFAVTKDYELLDGPGRLGEYYAETGNLKYFQSRFWFYYDLLYSKPYGRLGTYLIGIFMGYYLYRTKSNTPRNWNQLSTTFGWIMAAAFLWLSIFALNWREESIMETAIYNAVKNLIFSFSLSWVIFVCVTNHGGRVNKFFSSKIFLVVSRVSYSTYLIHIIMIEGYFLSLESQIIHSVPKLLLYFSTVFLIIPTAFVVSVIFEAPIIRIIAMFSKETGKETESNKEE